MHFCYVTRVTRWPLSRYHWLRQQQVIYVKLLCCQLDIDDLLMRQPGVMFNVNNH